MDVNGWLFPAPERKSNFKEILDHVIWIPVMQQPIENVGVDKNLLVNAERDRFSIMKKLDKMSPEPGRRIREMNTQPMMLSQPTLLQKEESIKRDTFLKSTEDFTDKKLKPVNLKFSFKKFRNETDKFSKTRNNISIKLNDKGKAHPTQAVYTATTVQPSIPPFDHSKSIKKLPMYASYLH